MAALDFPPYPVFLKLQDRTVVLIGGGQVALAKVNGLIASAARIRLIAPELHADLCALARAPSIEWIPRAYQSGDLAGAVLAIAATSNRDLNAQVAADARSLGVPINVVDDPEECDWISPAVARRQHLTVAISTGGRSPSLARLLRERIEGEVIPPGLPELLDVIAEERALRLKAGEHLPYARWRLAVSEEALAAAAAGDLALARAWVRRVLGRPPAAAARRANLAAPSSEDKQVWRAQPGVTYLVGAGPGDAGLLTVRGRALLATAEVVLYDRLVDPALLALSRPDAELIFVGKHGGGNYLPQERIHALLQEHAGAGRSVVRLKGGDPFVFGRGGEECEALAERGLPFVVVPGVSSALAAPAAAGIPITHREFGSSFAVVTGHEVPGRGASRLDWSALARVDTLVVLMGVGRLPAITEALGQSGMPPDRPAAVIERGTLPEQRVVTGELSDIAERAIAEAIGSPAILVLGEVVRVRERLEALARATVVA